MEPWRPKLGVSACVAGHPVRFNGSCAHQGRILDTLSEQVELVPLCPEVAMGLGTPREALRLVRSGESLRLRTSHSGRDLTELATATISRLVTALPADLDGYVLMGKSPTCGPERVRIYDGSVPLRTGTGLFAAELVRQRPELAIVEAGRLTDPAQREAFLVHLFGMARFRRLPRSVRALQEFHRRHKFLLLAQGGGERLRCLGRLAAAAKQETLDDTRRAYGTLLADTLAVLPERSRQTDALTHMYGFLKHQLESDERHALLARISEFQRGELPLVVPLSLLAFANERVGNRYLAEQAFFEPFPAKARRQGGERCRES